MSKTKKKESQASWKFIKENPLPLLGLATVLFWNVFYQVWQGQNLLDSDMASEIILANVLNKNHAVLTNEWLYSNGLKFFSMQWIYRIGMVLFPWNWHIVRTFSMLIALLMLAFSDVFFFYSFGQTKYGVFAAILALLPCGGWYFWQTLYGGYYIFTICVSLVTIGLTFIAAKDVKAIRSKVYILLIVLIAVGKGVNDIRQAMYCYVPFIVAALILHIYSVYTNTEKKKLTQNIFVVSLIGGGANLAGYLLNILYLSKKYSVRTYGENHIEAKSFLEMIGKLIHSYGFADGKELFSLSGIASMTGVVLGILVVFSAVRLLFMLKAMEFYDRAMVIVCEGILFISIFSMTFLENGVIQYYQPILPFGLFLIVEWLKNEKFMEALHGKICMGLVLAIAIITSAGTVYNESHEPVHDYRAFPQMNTVAKWLCEHGYEKGVSGFWTSNIITELSDGRIEMWTLKWDEPEVDEWLQLRSHLDGLPEGKYFYLYDKVQGEYTPYSFASDHPELDQIYEDEYCIIFGN